jgi:hypothetical protein
MYDGHHVRPGPINLAMNEALRVARVRIPAHPLAVEVIFGDVGPRHHTGRNVASEEIMIRVLLATQAHVTVRIQNSVHGEDVVRQNQFIDL